MSKEKFFCKGCRRMFDVPKFYDESHGLDSPPYERVAVCPRCDGDDFLRFDPVIEKIEIAEKLLPAIMHLNRYMRDLNNVFGGEIKNTDLLEGVGIMAEEINEMFDFLPPEIEKKIFEMDIQGDCERMLMYLKGEL